MLRRRESAAESSLVVLLLQIDSNGVSLLIVKTGYVRLRSVVRVRSTRVRSTWLIIGLLVAIAGELTELECGCAMNAPRSVPPRGSIALQLEPPANKTQLAFDSPIPSLGAARLKRL